MQLQRKTLSAAGWAAAGVTVPQFDVDRAAKAAQNRPAWVHFGAGNIFRAFVAASHQALLEAGHAESGLIVAEGYDYEIVDSMLTPHDNLTLSVTLKSDGAIDKTIIASITESLKADSGNAADFARLREIFAAPTLQMASFTITEKGYSLHRADDSLAPDVAADFAAGPAKPASYMGKVTALVYARFQAGRLPLALVSMDNCSRNGDKLRDAVCAFARAWEEKGLVAAGFASYLADREAVSFPWSMIDKITPRPDDRIQAMLAECGIEGMGGIVTGKNTFVAPFVNAEETEYLIIEDWFPNGRPALEKAGTMFTDRETVDRVEKMKVCTCLNPIHTGLAVFGCLLGYKSICEEMKDEVLVRLAKRIGYDEGLPVVVDPKILTPRAFLDTVITVRLPNPFMPDTPQRIATDTSQKLAIRFGETVRAYLRDGRDLNSLIAIPLVMAGWCRYLLGVDDDGEAFDLSPDPLLPSVLPHLAGLEIGKPYVPGTLRPIFSNAAIFGLDLYSCGLGERAETYFAAMLGGKGAVRTAMRDILPR